MVSDVVVLIDTVDAIVFVCSYGRSICTFSVSVLMFVLFIRTVCPICLSSLSLIALTMMSNAVVIIDACDAIVEIDVIV